MLLLTFILVLQRRSAKLGQITSQAHEMHGEQIKRQTGESIMTKEATVQDHLDEAVAARNRANMYSFLATLLNERPDTALIENLKMAGGEFICALANEASLTGSAAEGFQAMAKFVEENKSLPEQQVRQDLAVDWTRLFRGLSPAYSPMP